MFLIEAIISSIFIRSMKKKESKGICYKGSIGALPFFPGMHYLDVPPAVVKKLGGYRVRLVCTVNKSIQFQCGLMALGQGHGYIMFTKKRLQELGAQAGDKVSVELKLDTSTYGLPMPKELAEVLRQDPAAKQRFKKLSPGKQRNILHYVGSAKNIDLRIERALLLMENLKVLPIGKESMALLLKK